MADFSERLKQVNPLRYESCQQYLLAIGYCFDPAAQAFTHEEASAGDIPAASLGKLSPPYVLARYLGRNMS